MQKSSISKFIKVIGPIFLTIFIVIFMQACDSGDNNTSGSNSNEITKTQYNAAKKEHSNLVATNKKLDQELKDTNKQRQDIESQQSNVEDQAAQEVIDEQGGSQSNPADNNQSTNSDGTNNADSGDQTISGNSSQYIIGNVNSHVYHLPGQRGYTMKSKNAVYFNSEQEAINAGYRKAKQ
ncbi:MAG: hypothetical protein LKE77_12455 [Companilactobacillus sp.]|jgi:hypothetical protein|nr:hypothetical protein [Companilactobacillus sp.]MCH4009585.1 hypothetical protein [Companilactobacillus sp.]MCH4052739.1 hypothetical protein [Companilactobacillus sp.]MCH4077527.1 hypothetical protein [Companilactobacillus sp.]MCH4126103.1 hypothetical protein [Companilactobacillus sp.]MCI1311811.1 hypothetical protein [Companilactobacillus sp.]